MDTTPTPPLDLQTPEQRAKREQLRKHLTRLANGLDTAFRIPGTSIRFGADALIGLIPGIGDAFGLLMGMWMIWQARDVRAPNRLQLKMLGNLGVETLVGIVPVVGDAFDVVWQANQRNRRILMEWMDEQDKEQQQEGGPRWLLVLAIVGALIAMMFALNQA